MKKSLVLGAILGVIISQVAVAEVTPRYSKDSRVRWVNYDPDEVTEVNVKIGTVTMVQVGEDETIGSNGGFALGDPLAWNVGIENNSVFLRPKAPMPDTNIVFTTEKRAYSLYLKTVEDQNPYYIVRYKYPDEVRKKKQAEAKQKAEKQREEAIRIAKSQNLPCTDGFVHTLYEYKGDRSSQAILPSSVWADGKFTCMRFNSELPVAYTLKGGEEEITNSHMKDNIMVIHDTGDHFILRSGKQVIEIRKGQSGVRSNPAKSFLKMGYD